MRRFLITGLLLILALFSLAACGDDSSTTGADGMDASGGMSGGMSGDSGMDDATESNAPVADGAREIGVGATSFAFDPDEIRISAGEDVAIVLTSEDILHDFFVEDGASHVAAADAGDTAAGGLRIDEPGTYTFYCSVEGHREAGMEGTLVVE